MIDPPLLRCVGIESDFDIEFTAGDSSDNIGSAGAGAGVVKFASSICLTSDSSNFTSFQVFPSITVTEQKVDGFATSMSTLAVWIFFRCNGQWKNQLVDESVICQDSEDNSATVVCSYLIWLSLTCVWLVQTHQVSLLGSDSHISVPHLTPNVCISSMGSHSYLCPHINTHFIRVICEISLLA